MALASVWRPAACVLTVLLSLVLVTGPSVAQTFDDTEAQLRIRQASSAVAAAEREVEDLRKALDAERKKVVKTEDERELNQEMVKTLDKNLKEAEARLREREAVLAKAQDDRKRGLSTEAEKRQREDQDRQRAEEERRRREALNAPPVPTPVPVPPLPSMPTEQEPNFTLLERQKLQVALAAQGHNPGAPDGEIGPNTRRMIAAWQRSRNEAGTGFITRTQYNALMTASAAAVKKFEDDQKAPPPSTTAGAGESYHITNSCRYPVRMFIRYRAVSGEWQSAGWWTFAPNENAYLSHAGSRITSKNSIWYFYAELNNATYKWEGDHSVTYNGRTYKMRQREDKVGTNKLNLTCANAP